MSLDLYFATDGPRSLFNRARFHQLFHGKPNFEFHQLAGGSFQLWYANETTAVTFSFDYSVPDAASEEGPRLPPGFQDSGLYFNLNYNRPTFFALEAMPFVCQVAKEFELLMADPQETGDDLLDIPRAYRVEELIASWERQNVWAVRALYADAELQGQYRFLPRERSLYFWNYMKEKDQFQEDQNEDVFVPSIVLLYRQGQIRIQTAVVWSDALPQVFPQCDLIIRSVVKEIHGETKSVDLQVVPFSSFFTEAKGIAELCPGPVPGLLVLRPHLENEIRRLFDKLSGHSFDEYNGVSPDSFVDVYLPDLEKVAVQ